MPSNSMGSIVLGIRARQLRQLCALLALGISVVALIGWLLHNDLLRSVIATFTTMKANAAIGAVAAAVAMLLVPAGSLGTLNHRRRGMIFAASALPILLGALTLLEYVFGMSLGLDELFVLDPHTTSPPYPGRMSPATALGLMAAGAAPLLLIGSRSRRSDTVLGAHVLALLPAGVGYLGLAGYAYDVTGLHKFGPFITVALNTSVVLALLALSIWLTASDKGWGRSFADTPIAHRVLMQLLPISVAVPFMAGAMVVLGARHRLYEPLYGTPILALVAAASALFITWLGTMAIRSAESRLAATTEALRASEERLRIAQSAGQVGTFEWFPDTGRMDVSDEYRRLWGLSATEEVTAKRLVSLLHPLDRSLSGPARLTPDHNPLEQAEFRMIQPDSGQERWIARRGEVVSTDLSSPDAPRRYLGAAFDITDRKHAEARVAASEQRFRSLADNIPTLCWTADATGAIGWYNRRWYEYTGTTLELMQGWGWQSVHDPRVLPSVMERWTACIAKGIDFEMTFPLKGVDGTYREFLTRVAPLRNEHGIVESWFGTNTDVSKQLAAEAALHEADRLKDEFLAMLAHELRNPLAPIRNAVKLLTASASTDAKMRAREIIERQSTHMARLLDDLLDVSRITRGKVELHCAVLDLREVIENVVDSNRQSIEELRHEMCVRLPDRPLWVNGDATRLFQIIDNLLQNSAKYMEAGRIEIAAYASSDSATVIVTDTGIGIAPEFMERLFDLFTQAHTEPRERSGLGIGLAVVQRLVTLHGGTVEARSAGLGHGSSFQITLPLASRPSVSETPPPAAHGKSRDDAMPSVLLIDDQPDILESLAWILRDLGYPVHVAEDGAAGISVAESLRPQIMIVDIGMPKIDGFEVARWVRRQAWGQSPRMIAVTGWGQAEDRRRTREAGFDEHLVKPVDPDVLIHRMESLFQSNRVTTEPAESLKISAGNRGLTAVGGRRST